MGDLANLTIWDDPAICGALSWYLNVAENRRPAKFRNLFFVPTATITLIPTGSTAGTMSQRCCSIRT